MKSLIRGSVVWCAFASSAFAQANDFNKIVGKWVSEQEQYVFRIESDGQVFSHNPNFPLSGAVGACISGGGNFCFEGQAPGGKIYTCAYRISFPTGTTNRLIFGVTLNSYVGCPRGGFTRVS